MPTQLKEVDPIEPPKKRGALWVNLGIFFSTIALVVLVGAFGVCYFQLANMNVALARQTNKLQKQMTVQDAEIAELQQGTAIVQSLAAKQEQAMTEWKAAERAGIDKWHFAEAHYLVKLANDQLQLVGNVQVALAILQRADQILQTMPETAASPLRSALTSDIAKLQALPKVDEANLYARLNSLNQVVDQLPLPLTPMQTNPDDVATVNVPNDLPWWKKILAGAWQALHKLVIIKNENTNYMPLVLPEEKVFLYQNLHAQLENASWAVLHHNGVVYQASLARTSMWIKQYFVQTAPLTISVLQAIDALQTVNVQSPNVDLTPTLQLFERFAAKAQTTP